MGATITEIKKPVFINKPEFDYCVKNRNSVVSPNDLSITMWFKKSRGICIDGVMKNTKCYHVVLDLEYLQYLKGLMLKGNSIQVVIADLFPGKNICVQAGHYYPIYKGDKWNGKNVNLAAYYFKESDLTDTYEFDAYELEDFVLEKKTKKEEERIKLKEDRKKSEAFNTMMLKNVILEALKKANISVYETRKSYRYDDRSFMAVTDKTDWNKLVLLAVNKYLNDIAKEYGFSIKQPKFMKNANITYESPLFFMDEVEMLNQENNN